MMWSRATKAALVAILLAMVSTAAAAKGKIGFATEAASSAFISPVLDSLEVAKVRSGSIAAAAGLKSGEVNSTTNCDNHPLRWSLVLVVRLPRADILRRPLSNRLPSNRRSSPMGRPC